MIPTTPHYREPVNLQWPSWPYSAYVLAVFLACVGVWLRSTLSQGKLRRLPGPRPVPFIGNLHQLASGNERFKQFQDWHAQYGPLVSLKLGSKNMIIIGGDGTLVRELLDKRGAIYSSRPTRRLAHVMDEGETPISERDTNKWRVNRKLIVQSFSSIHSARTKEVHVPIIEAESTQLLFDLLQRPQDFMHHPMRFASSVMTSMIYGIRGRSYDHYTVKGIEEIMIAEDQVNKFGPLIDTFPILQYAPDWLWPWKKKTAWLGMLRKELYKDLADHAKERIDHGVNSESFAHRVFSARETMHLSDRRVHMLLATAFEGGSDIVANVLLSCFIALYNYPEVLRKAREEIDSICDEDTMPCGNDWDRLPYIRMVTKETLRWRPPFPWGVMHALEEDDMWNGYLLPKNSTILLNIWNIHMNPTRYPDPETFRPERFANVPLSSSEYINSPDPFLRDHFTFGAGRRACPGLVIADMDLFLAISKIIWAFDLVGDGKPLEMAQETAFVGTHLRQPRPFKIDFRPRSEARARTIRAELGVLEENFFPQFS